MQRYTARRPTYSAKYRTQRKKRKLTYSMKGMTASKSSLVTRQYNKFYPSLPPNLHLCIPSYGDTRYQFSTFTAAGLGAQCTYVFYNTLDLLAVIQAGALDFAENLFCPQINYLMGIYQEARFKMQKMSFDFSLDNVFTNFISGNSQNPPDRLDVAIGVVPISYMRNSSGTSLTAVNAGTQFIGVDYYSALTHMKGAQFFSLTTDGTKSNYKAQVYIDGLSHTGNNLSITSSNAWEPTTRVPSTTVTYPTTTQQQVVLLAMRYKTHTDTNISNDFFVRTSIKLDSHLHFTDRVPECPYVVSSQII